MPTLFSQAYVTSMPGLVSSLLNSYGKSYNLKKYYSKTGKVTFFKQIMVLSLVITHIK